jgi:intergrase/recombinase
MDIVRAFTNLSDGQVHNLNRALASLLRFYELKGVDPKYLTTLRKAFPKNPEFIDLYVPTEDEILASLKKLNLLPLKYQAFYNLALDSGLRMKEVPLSINKFDKITEGKGFFRCPLGYFRGCKLAYAGYSHLTRNN